MNVLTFHHYTITFLNLVNLDLRHHIASEIHI